MKRIERIKPVVVCYDSKLQGHRIQCADTVLTFTDEHETDEGVVAFFKRLMPLACQTTSDGDKRYFCWRANVAFDILKADFTELK